MKRSFQDILGHNLSKTAKNILNQVISNDMYEYIKEVKQDSITFEYQDIPFTAKRQSNNIKLTYMNNEVVINEYISDENVPIYSYIQNISGGDYQTYAVGYVKVQNIHNKDVILSSGAATVVFNNEVIDRYQNEFLNLFQMTELDYFDKLSILVDNISKKDNIKPDYLVMANYRPDITGKNRLIINVNNHMSLVNQEISNNGDNIKENLDILKFIIDQNLDKYNMINNIENITEDLHHNALEAVQNHDTRKQTRRTI